jgi:hypothetical protein
MDSSTSQHNVRLVLDGMTISLDKLTHLEMVDITLDLLNKAKPAMKYLPRFIPLQEAMSSPTDGIHEVIMPSSADFITYPPRIDERTKVAHITTLSHTSGAKVVCQKRLMLTDDARILVWAVDFSSPNGPGGRHIIAGSHFDELTRKRLEELAGQGHLWRGINWKKVMHGILWAVLIRQQEMVEALKSRLQTGQQALERLEIPFYRITDA